MRNTRTIGIATLTVMMAMTGWGMGKIATADGMAVAAVSRTTCPPAGKAANPPTTDIQNSSPGQAANTSAGDTQNQPTGRPADSSAADAQSPATGGTACASTGEAAAPSVGESPRFTPGARDGLACSPEGAVIRGVNGTTFTCARKGGRQSVWVAK